MESKNNKQILRFINVVRDQIGYYNSFGNSILLILLKFALSKPDKIGRLTSSSFETLFNFQRKMDDVILGRNDFDASDFAQILDMIDDQLYSANTKPFLFHDMTDTYVKMFAKQHSQAIVFQALKELELPTERDEMSEMIETLLERAARDISRTMEYSTPKSIRKLALKLLKLNDNDVYLDPFCGYSTSLLSADKFRTYIGYDISHEAIAVSTAIDVLLGIQDCQLNVDDFGSNPLKEYADKVFADIPINIKSNCFELRLEYSDITKDSYVAYLFKTIDALRDGGTAVITTVGRTLFSTMRGYEQFREKYSAEGLKAVIELPALWNGTSVSTNMIVIQKGYQGSIEFISAKEMGAKINGQFILSDSTIGKICKCIEDNLTEESFCIAAKRSDVITNNSWSPNKYTITKIEESIYRNEKEIDEELKDLYQQFFDNNK